MGNHFEQAFIKSLNIHKKKTFIAMYKNYKNRNKQ